MRNIHLTYSFLEEPAMYSLEYGTFFGFQGKMLRASRQNIEVLVAQPNSVRWQAMNGRFSNKYLGKARIVKGCHENDIEHIEVAIARAWARKHVHRGVLTETKFVHPGKASSKLEGEAYVLTGGDVKEVKVSWKPFRFWCRIVYRRSPDSSG